MILLLVECKYKFCLWKLTQRKDVSLLCFVWVFFCFAFSFLIKMRTLGVSQKFLIFAVREHGSSINGPKDWKNISQHCVENAQSPINIVTSKVERNSYLIGFSFTPDHLMGSVTGTLVNNGHAPTFTVDSSKGSALLTGGPWGDSSVYKLQQLHFHFGCEASRGSEHAVDGKVYSGEVRRFNDNRT